MKWLAVFLAPLVGTIGLIFSFILGCTIQKFDFLKTNFDLIVTVQIGGTIYLCALMIQFFIVEPTIYVYSTFDNFTLKEYCLIGIIFSVIFTILIGNFFGDKDFFYPLLLLLIYSVGNAITYNELYFKQLEK